MDREKVIKGLERCKLYNKVNCDKCPYDYNGRGNGKSECTAELATDALALLKEQEDTINELQNAYGYLQKQFFEAQDKLLKEQDAIVHPEPSCELTYITDCCCDLCGVQLIREDNFCRCCGKRIKWEGR